MDFPNVLPMKTTYLACSQPEIFANLVRELAKRETLAYVAVAVALKFSTFFALLNITRNVANTAVNFVRPILFFVVSAVLFCPPY